MTNIVLLLMGYFIGAVPSAYLFGRLFKGADVRKLGSGNVGAMNTFRHIGLVPGLLTFAVDLGKGFLVVLLAVKFGKSEWSPALIPIAVILGHNYNVFLRFKGGKGIAALIGILLALSPLTILFLFCFIALLALIFHDTNAATGAGMAALPILLPSLTGQSLYFTTSLAITLLIMSKYLPDFKAYHAGRRKLI